ncbi:hypothetical protein [Pseudobacter ginsenosidimutans]|uniref:DUF4397 domain-containing protein n=1 Tax=Pseudobacter ginsenosidimutans TaxID=661488 RepID=A0A4Q7MYH7_9BACT|nr:hypothetical protein [Pseudobacter ginsenosidimutans]QEC42918.1 hypothetical protein FSB84_14940 [Pseudobacter ginsenosidimutans]RZS74271.1 hypothetical protein EV199_0115 [Pseudobacter ginsenosidimutans]
MKKLQQFKRAFLFMMISWMLLTGCTKDFDRPGVASLNIFNGIVGATTVAPDMSEASPIQWYKTSNLLLYGAAGNLNPTTNRNNVQFNSYSGMQRFKFFNYPDTLAHSKPLLDVVLDLPVGTVSSLYLTGTTEAPDTVFARDQLAYHSFADSVTSLRMVNLIPELTVNVNQQGSPDENEWSSLGYKSISAFRDFSLTGTGAKYIFEIKDAATGNLVTTATVDAADRRQSTSFINYYRFKNLTMILYGKAGNTGATAPKVAIMSNN